MKRILSTLFILFISVSTYAQTLQGALPSGTYSGTYEVTGDIWVDPGESITIDPGTRFLFTDHYKFDIWGRVDAIGTFDEPIYFTTTDKNPYWNGIRIDRSSGSITGPQHFEHCFFENGKKTGNDCMTNAGMANAWGGLVYIRRWREAKFYSCTFIMSEAKAGGAMAVVEAADVLLRECFFAKNHARNHGGGLFFRHACTGTVNLTRFESNTAGLNGGGVFSGSKDLPQQGVFIGCEVEFEECEFTTNEAVKGGGVYNEASTLNFEGSHFYENHAISTLYGGVQLDGNGGAIAVSRGGYSTITYGNLHHNTATENGGAGYVSSTSDYTGLHFRNCQIMNCSAGLNGGALYANGSHAESDFRDGEVSDCRAESGGAAAIMDGAHHSSWHMKFNKNGATTRGGALYFYEPSRTCGVLNCLITNNTSNLYGGGIHIQYNATPTDVMYMQSNTIAKNIAHIGGGLAGELLPWNYGYYRIANTIIFENTANGGSQYNDVFNVAGNLFSHCQVNSAGLSGLDATNVTVAPNFMSAIDFRVHSYSAGVDMGRNSTPIGIYSDLNGATRTQNGTMDIGAYEDDPNNPIRMANPAMSQNQANNMLMYPNPTNSDVYFEITLNEDSKVRYEVINELGQVCKSVDAGVVAKGLYNESMDVSDLPSGYYIVRFVINNKVELKKLSVKQ